MARWNRADAAKRLKNLREGLEFLVRLSQSDPSVLTSADRPGDLLNICAGLGRLVHPVARDGAENPPTELWLEDLRRPPQILPILIRNLATLLEGVADGGECSIVVSPGTKVIISPQYCIESPPSPNGSVQSVLLALGILLQEAGPGLKPRRCTREACRRIFVPNRPKQEFCRRSCASAAAFERYKERLGTEAYRASRAKNAKRPRQGSGKAGHSARKASAVDALV